MISRRGKSSVVQEFPEQNLAKWRENVRQEPTEAHALLEGVWEGATSHGQLANLKKLCAVVQGMAKAGSLAGSSLAPVLVEMHALCLSRHPLQRAIASPSLLTSLLQSLPEPHPLSVTNHAHSTIAVVLSGRWLTSHTHRLHYLEALTENFPLGEVALRKQLPLVIQYCVSVIQTCHSENRLTDAVLTTSLKTTMSILHKTQPVLQCLLSGEKRFQFQHGEPLCMVTWPDEVEGQSSEVKGQWIKHLLEKAAGLCASFLKRGGAVPHDLTVAAAMLYVVVVMRTNLEGRGFEMKVTEVTSNWLTEDSPLEPFPQLSVCHALLAKLPPSQLLLDTVGQPLLLKLFPITCRLFSRFTETSNRYIASRTLALWTTVARQCAGVVAMGDGVYEALLPSGHIVNTMLQYVWTLWEDPVDGIRHQCRAMFENIIGTCRQLEGLGNSFSPSPSPSPSPFLLSLTNSLLSLTSPTRGKYQLLSTLSHHLPVTTLLSTAPSLPTELLSVMGHQALACHAGELWSRLAQLHWEAVDDPQGEKLWTETWVDTLVQSMVSAGSLARQHIIQHCLPSLFESCGRSMELVRRSLKHIDTASPDSVLTTELACLRCAKGRQRSFPWEESHEATFTAAMHHIDEQIQLSALGLLCESHRSTEAPLPSSLPLLLRFLTLNACTQSPNFRYPMITAVKKLLVRIRDSSYAMSKLHQKGRGPDPTDHIKSYQEFLQCLLNQQFHSLHPFSSYQRRHTALSILQLMSGIFTSSSSPSSSSSSSSSSCPSTSSSSSSSSSSCPSTSSSSSSSHGPSASPDGIPPVFEFAVAVSDTQSRRLVHSLRDSYDANRALALQLLCQLPWQRVTLTDAGFLKACSASFLKLVRSPKAVDCMSASFLLRLLLRGSCTEFHHTLQHQAAELFSELQPQGEGGEIPPQWAVVSTLLSLLQQQLQTAKTDLLSASVEAPMYGTLQSIRTALEEAREMSPPSAVLPVCRSAVAEVVGLCEEAAALASPVVCNSSPEGFLPGAEGVAAAVPSPLPPSSLVGGASAQSLLLCCWHAMKEISLLLGLVVEWAPIGDNTDTLLTHKQLDTIASVFIDQLMEARHRGAFEMAYSGFQKLCRCLWNSTSQELQLKPVRWVEELLDSLQSTSLTRLLSITRRSAGLPFFLQAILTSEPSHTGQPCLKTAMRTLLNVAQNCRKPTCVTMTPPSSDSTPSNTEDIATSGTQLPSPAGDEQQPPSASVHALNILRALFRDSRLGELVLPYIPEGVMVAIQGFSATFWPVRNSSTLLFSALVTRIFGAKRVQDEHSVENKMTAREFFTRFPTLHGFLLQELRQSASDLDMARGPCMDSLQPSLFPVLLLLSRLYPTALDEALSPTSLQPFLPLLLQCSSCAVWKTRVLISQTVAPLLSQHNAESILATILEQLDTSDQNRLHCRLLVVCQVVRERKDLLDGVLCLGEGVALGVWLLEQLLRRLSIGLRANTCPITRCSYHKLVTALATHVLGKQQALNHELATALTSLAKEVEENLLSGRPEGQSLLHEEVLVSSCRLLFSLASHPTEAGSTGVAVSRTNELVCRCLRHDSPSVRLCVLDYLGTHLELCLEVGVVTLMVGLTDTERDEDILTGLYSLLVRAIDGRCLPSEAITSLATRATELLARTCLRFQLRLAVLLFLSASLEASCEAKEVARWLSSVQPYTHPTTPVELRQGVATGLSHLWRILTQDGSCQQAVLYCKLVVTLLQDGEEEVRDEMATSVGKIFSHLSQLPGFLQATTSTLPASSLPSTSSALPSASSTVPSASSALPSFLSILPHVFREHASTALTVLLQLVALDLEPSETDSDHGNLLFEEDPLNNYMEETVVLAAACQGVQTLVSSHYHQLESAIGHTAQQLCSTATALLERCSEVGGVSFSPWEKPKLYLGLCRVSLLSEAIVCGCVDMSLPYCQSLPMDQLREYAALKSKLLL